YQRTVDIFRLYLYGFGLWRQVVADEQGRAVIKMDGHIAGAAPFAGTGGNVDFAGLRSEEHTSELQSRFDLVCRLLLEKKRCMRIPMKARWRLFWGVAGLHRRAPSG